MWQLYPVAAGGSRKRPLVRRRPSVSESSPGRTTRIRNDMGDSNSGVVLGAMAFTIATIGINIVANFVSPAFDFSNVAPSRISWRTGGMIAAVASVFITPWNLFNNPAVIHNTLDVLACAIGPLYGILLVDYYRLKKQRMVLEDLYTMSPSGAYWYSHGFNLSAVYALIGASLISFLCVMVPAISWLANFSWFIGVLAGALFYRMLLWE
jgi:NCS1 family nucleobase:cation symporter-1